MASVLLWHFLIITNYCCLKERLMCAHSSVKCICGHQRQLCGVGSLFLPLCSSWDLAQVIGGFAQQVGLSIEISPVHVEQLLNNVHCQSCMSSVLMITCHYFSWKTWDACGGRRQRKWKYSFIPHSDFFLSKFNNISPVLWFDVHCSCQEAARFLLSSVPGRLWHMNHG